MAMRLPLEPDLEQLVEEFCHAIRLSRSQVELVETDNSARFWGRSYSYGSDSAVGGAAAVATAGADAAAGASAAAAASGGTAVQTGADVGVAADAEAVVATGGARASLRCSPCTVSTCRTGQHVPCLRIRDAPESGVWHLAARGWCIVTESRVMRKEDDDIAFVRLPAADEYKPCDVHVDSIVLDVGAKAMETAGDLSKVNSNISGNVQKEFRSDEYLMLTQTVGFGPDKRILMDVGAWARLQAVSSSGTSEQPLSNEEFVFVFEATVQEVLNEVISTQRVPRMSSDYEEELLREAAGIHAALVEAGRPGLLYDNRSAAASPAGGAAAVTRQALAGGSPSSQGRKRKGKEVEEEGEVGTATTGKQAAVSAHARTAGPIPFPFNELEGLVSHIASAFRLNATRQPNATEDERRAAYASVTGSTPLTVQMDDDNIPAVNMFDFAVTRSRAGKVLAQLPPPLPFRAVWGPPKTGRFTSAVVGNLLPPGTIVVSDVKKTGIQPRAGVVICGHSEHGWGGYSVPVLCLCDSCSETDDALQRIFDLKTAFHRHAGQESLDTAAFNCHAVVWFPMEGAPADDDLLFSEDVDSPTTPGLTGLVVVSIHRLLAGWAKVGGRPLRRLPEGLFSAASPRPDWRLPADPQKLPRFRRARELIEEWHGRMTRLSSTPADATQHAFNAVLSEIPPASEAEARTAADAAHAAAESAVLARPRTEYIFQTRNGAEGTGSRVGLEGEDEEVKEGKRERRKKEAGGGKDRKG
ncbi:hypothetical protein Agub_g15451 [Astrephomene gubernaculifera]|uniref:Uncharacterized protein n=2 Tax=Astrephomene gubernaculifera TaxID=47775 RepID=A0AAD3E5J7_9CHLO|nr:hypothetical protein Agub_g14881 [Astrephomene gubernaculifera]GFR52854.1 hypothetical protein Agub_g15451 [Astrephomene gubernaculifera]